MDPQGPKHARDPWGSAEKGVLPAILHSLKSITYPILAIKDHQDPLRVSKGYLKIIQGHGHRFTSYLRAINGCQGPFEVHLRF